MSFLPRPPSFSGLFFYSMLRNGVTLAPKSSRSEQAMRRIISVSLTLLFLALTAAAQHAAVAFCALDKTVDFKLAKTGDKVALHLTRDLVVNGKTVMQRGTTLSATVVDAKNGNTLSIVLDKATPTPGEDVPLMGIVAAVATPPGALTEDPFYSMNRSEEPTQRTGNVAVTSQATSGAAVQTAMLKGEADPKSNLREDSSGAIGIDGLKLNWVLDKAPATTVLTAKKKNFKLQRGTEILLRMAPPKI
jgi:hypothetical protein